MIPFERAGDERVRDALVQDDRGVRAVYHRNRRERPGDRMSCLALVSFFFTKENMQGSGSGRIQLTYFELVNELLYGRLVAGEVLGRGRHIDGVREKSNDHRSCINGMVVFIVRARTEVDQRPALGNLQNGLGIFLLEICAVDVSLRSSSGG